MKFYVRNNEQENYQYQKDDNPRGMSIYQMKPNDIWCSLIADYYIDEVDKLSRIVYATKTILSKPRNNSFYIECNIYHKKKIIFK